jgi:high-affinity iron transporter
MGNILFVVWRESLEAVLIIGILHSFLVRRAGTSATRGVRMMWAGVVAGLALSAFLAYLTVVIQDQLQGHALDIFQTSILFVSAALMTQMVMWMNKHGRRLKTELETELNHAMSSSGAWGAGLVAMFAIAREGTETSVYLYGLALENSALTQGWMMAGAAILGVVLALATASVVSRGIRFLNYQTFFKVTSYALLFSAAGLVVSGTGRLIEMDFLPTLVDPIWNTSWILDSGHGVGAFIGSLTGYRARPSLMLALIYAGYWILGLGILNRALWMPHPRAKLQQAPASVSFQV